MSTPGQIFSGCAGWSLNRQHADDFPAAGSHLQRYAAVFNAVEVNSSFYRSHRPQTWVRWAGSVGNGFRFSVKMPRAISHEQRLLHCEPLLDAFFNECFGLGDKLGCLLLQLPPSLDYQPDRADRFFDALRQRFGGPLVIEPRHASWGNAQQQLVDYRIAQVAADPVRPGFDAQPSGWPGLQYWRLHGSPQIYHSAYSHAYLQQLSAILRRASAAGISPWCVFDNTASGAALDNALTLRRLLQQGAD